MARKARLSRLIEVRTRLAYTPPFLRIPSPCSQHHLDPSGSLCLTLSYVLWTLRKAMSRWRDLLYGCCDDDQRTGPGEPIQLVNLDQRRPRSGSAAVRSTAGTGNTSGVHPSAAGTTGTAGVPANAYPPAPTHSNNPAPANAYNQAPANPVTTAPVGSPQANYGSPPAQGVQGHFGSLQEGTGTDNEHTTAGINSIESGIADMEMALAKIDRHRYLITDDREREEMTEELRVKSSNFNISLVSTVLLLKVPLHHLAFQKEAKQANALNMRRHLWMPSSRKARYHEVFHESFIRDSMGFVVGVMQPLRTWRVSWEIKEVFRPAPVLKPGRVRGGHEERNALKLGTPEKERYETSFCIWSGETKEHS
ncbi:hypothetical protein K402DRAFT_457046 [Aulographum hederae CBS 113979]|uniref:Uncharacterized protein n=1 Tax=Aulographum hederae CBS 113979 TaxID=1176131 RepID=A0A6G1GPX3_9PEZI|nr:hypothetical protein K402DRAFT_457046 [Aulographum hederae CBS 113979]